MAGTTPTRTFFVIAAVCMVVKLWLLTAHDLVASHSPHDDLLFIKQATALASGEWLGEYNQLTLSKGAFYPLFIAFCYWLGIPLMAGQQLLWGTGCIVFVLAIYPEIKKTSIATLIFLFLLMIPTTYFYLATGRIFRLNVYASLVLLIIAFYLGMLVRDERSWREKVVWAAAGGFSFAAFWNTREESIFLVPAVALIFLYHVFTWWKNNRGWRSFVQLVSLYLVPVSVIAGFGAIISYQNYKNYGVYTRLELNTPEFKSAYGALQRIRSDKWRQYYPVVEDARKQAYKVSPSFRELEPHLEDGVGAGWKIVGGDLHAAFFIWALRDSVVAAGYYKESQTTLDLYKRIGAEIDAACEDERLVCRAKSSQFMPQWHKEYNKSVLPVWWSIIRKVASFNNLSASTEGIRSNGPAESMLLFETITRERLLTSKKKILQATPEYHRHLNKEKIRILEDIGAFYQFLVTPLVILSLMCLVVSLIRSIYRRSTISRNLIFALASAGSLLSITFILTLLTITSYKQIDRALQVAYPLALLFIVFSFIELYQLYKKFRGGVDSSF